MGLVYNHKNKHDMVILSEEKLENPEGELYDFFIEPIDSGSTSEERIDLGLADASDTGVSKDAE